MSSIKIRRSDADDLITTKIYSSITATSSTLSSPGAAATPTALRAPSFSPKSSADDEVITPPTRPRSTPLQEQEELVDEAISLRLEDGTRHNSISLVGNQTVECPPSPSSKMVFDDLPVEINEVILDHLLGTRASTSSRALTPGSSAASRGWGTALRHSRRRERTDLALVSNTWRVLVQERLYRHIKIKGTTASLRQAEIWFKEHPHLQEYVKHIEIWIPVWERRTGSGPENLHLAPTTPDRTALIRVMNDQGIAGLDSYSSIGTAYQLSSGNAALDVIFNFVSNGFTEACILTLEGGHGKQPPRAMHFDKPGIEDKASPSVINVENQEDKTMLLLRRLPTLSNIRCLVIKGAWNIIRSEHDFSRILTATPDLEEIHYTYQEANSEAYLTIARGLPTIPRGISHINLLIEGNYTNEVATPMLWRNIYPKTHICHELAKVTPQLEHFQYTGRICHHFFDHAVSLADPDRRGNMKLRSLDLTVKNTCRALEGWPNGSGINDWPFIQSFERLVASGIKSLSRFRGLRYLRIRFIDLDSPLPLMNPYFQMKEGRCSGIWSEKLVEMLAKHRHEARYISLQDGIVGAASLASEPKDFFSRQRPASIKTSVYQTLSDPMFLNM